MGAIGKATLRRQCFDVREAARYPALHWWKAHFTQAGDINEAEVTRQTVKRAAGRGVAPFVIIPSGAPIACRSLPTRLLSGADQRECGTGLQPLAKGCVRVVGPQV